MVGHLSLVVLLTEMCDMLFWKITKSAIWKFSIWSSSSCIVLLHCLNIENQLKMFEKGPAAAEQRPDAEPGRPKPLLPSLSQMPSNFEMHLVEFSNVFVSIFCMYLSKLWNRVRPKYRAQPKTIASLPRKQWNAK